MSRSMCILEKNFQTWGRMRWEESFLEWETRLEQQAVSRERHFWKSFLRLVACFYSPRTDNSYWNGGIRWFVRMLCVCVLVAQSCPTLCDPVDCSTPGLLVHHQLLEFTHTHVHWVSDAIQPSHPLWSPSPPAFNLSQHQGLFKWVSSSHQIGWVLYLILGQGTDRFRSRGSWQ